MKLISSAAALDLIVALTQRRAGARLAELAAACRVPLPTAQSAVRILLADRIVERDGRARPRYRLRPDHPLRSAVVELAARSRPRSRVLDVALRSNPAVEFASRDRRGYVVVFGPLADAADALLLEQMLDLPDGPGVERFGHHELLEMLRDDRSLRGRARSGTRVKGTLARSFPEGHRRSRHGTALHRPNTALDKPSRRALAAVARRHGLERMRLFGSSVRSDFRPASDVDIVVEARLGAPLSFLDLARIEAELEALFDRHVDVVTPGGLSREARRDIDREAVAIVG